MYQERHRSTRHRAGEREVFFFCFIISFDISNMSDIPKDHLNNKYSAETEDKRKRVGLDSVSSVVSRGKASFFKEKRGCCDGYGFRDLGV